MSVLVESDDAPRTVDMPDDLAVALDGAAGARAAFDAASFSHRREWVESVEEAKRAAGCVTTRLRGSRYGRGQHAVAPRVPPPPVFARRLRAGHRTMRTGGTVTKRRQGGPACGAVQT